MVIGKTSQLSCAANFLRGRKCIFCGSYATCRTQRSYVKCNDCRRQKSLPQLRREIAFIRGFYRMQPANRVAYELGITYPTVTRVYQQLRKTVSRVAETEGMSLSGEIEIDESYFGGHRKGNLRTRRRRQKYRVGASGTRRQSVHESCRQCLGGGTAHAHPSPYTQGFGVLYGYVSQL